MTTPDSPLASFEAKWIAVHPELALALKFVGAGERRMQSAFACLVFELEYATFSIHEAEPATIKLQWWAEEFARTVKGEPRHPLSQVLAAYPGFAGIAPTHWREVVIGALAQRDPEPAADSAALFACYARLYAPLGAIESQLFGVDAMASSALMVAARALREAATLPRALQDGSLPLPLDLLARHRLTRNDLAESSARRNDALREWFRELAGELVGLAAADHSGASKPGASIGIVHAAAIAVDSRRALHAARASEPLTAINNALDHLSFAATWAAWRAARRSRT